jgi:diacylglycerol kinase
MKGNKPTPPSAPPAGGALGTPPERGLIFFLFMIRLFKSFTYAFRGLFKIFREEQNLQVQSIVAILIIILGFVLRIKLLEWCAVLISIALVILMETINSAVERLSDVLKPRIHTYIKEIKDIMAAAVMISAILAIVVGLIVFIPHILALWLI